MCCLDDTDDSTVASTLGATESRGTQASPRTQPSHRSYQSQSMHDAYSPSLTTREPSPAKEDDRSRALSSTIRGPDSDSSDTDDDAEHADMTSAASLFGSVVRNVGQTEQTRRPTRRLA